MIALFFNPFGFDAVQYWLISQTGSLWRANLVMYGIAVLFYGLYTYYQYKARKHDKAQGYN